MAMIGDGLAVGTDLDAAARSATAQALDALGGQPDLLCVFVCGDDQDAVRRAGEAAMARAGGAVTLGCSTGGVIGDGRGVELPNAVSVWAAALPGARITPFELRTGRAADRLIVTGMSEPNPDDQVALLLADPYTFPVDAFVEKSADVFDGLAFVGGLAGGFGDDDVQMFAGGLATDAGAVGVLLGGNLSVSTLVSQGCRPIGPAMTVTECDGNVITGLAGISALSKLEQVVSDLPATDRPAVADGLQIGIVMDEYSDEHERGDFLVRGVVDIDADAGSLTVGDVVEVGQTVRFQVRDPDLADEDMGRLLSTFGHDDFGPVEGALLFSCTGRGADMFVTADHDVRAVRRRLGTRRVAGFFASGEIGPVGGRNHVHSYSASILAFGTPADPG